MGATGGLTLKQAAKRSALLNTIDNYKSPQAVSADKYVVSVDPSGLTVGTALTIVAAQLGKLQRRARRLSVTATDASGTSLSITLVCVGFRNGYPVTDTITATGATSGTAVNGTKYFDEVVSVTPAAISNAASGDAVTVGIDALAFGLVRRIKAVNSVKSIVNVSTVTEAAPVAISSTTIDVANFAFVLPTGSLATSDDWTIQYIADGEDGFGPGGVRG